MIMFKTQSSGDEGYVDDVHEQNRGDTDCIEERYSIDIAGVLKTKLWIAKSKKQ